MNITLILVLLLVIYFLILNFLEIKESFTFMQMSPSTKHVIGHMMQTYYIKSVLSIYGILFEPKKQFKCFDIVSYL